VSRAASVLNAGGVAVLPAEGLYGIHVRPDRADALDRLARLKPRDGRSGWIGLVAVPEALADYAKPPAGAVALARAHWPGALTLVVRASSAVPPPLVARDGTVALRCPGSDFLRAVTRACGGLLLTTSANAPGERPPSRPEEIALEGIDLLVDQGPLSGVPSTIVRVDGEAIQVLREGAVRIGEGPLDGPGTGS
jgi:L-threonylcarbamoyladenylate synthase